MIETREIPVIVDKSPCIFTCPAVVSDGAVSRAPPWKARPNRDLRLEIALPAAGQMRVGE